MMNPPTSDSIQPAPAPYLPGGPALLALRVGTRELHAELEQRMPLSGMHVTAADYTTHVALIDAWLARLVPHLNVHRVRLKGPPGTPAVVWHADAGRDRIRLDQAQALQAGLAWPEPPPVCTLEPDLPDLPHGHSRHQRHAWSLGVLYVIEGSQLGGEVLRRRWGAALAPLALHYLSPAEDTGRRWMMFLRVLGQELTAPDDIQTALRGARQAFHELLRIVPAAASRGH